MYEQTNSMVEIEAELIDGDDEDDGIEVMVQYEIVQVMMINEQDEEVDMLQHHILWLEKNEVNDDELLQEHTEEFTLQKFNLFYK